MTAGDGETFAVRAPGRNATALPTLRSDSLFPLRFQLSDVGLVVSNEQDRFAVRGPASLRAFADHMLVRSVTVHHPDFRKPAAQRRIHDPLAVRGETGIGIWVLILGELLRVFAVGMHRPDF